MYSPDGGSSSSRQDGAAGRSAASKPPDTQEQDQTPAISYKNILEKITYGIKLINLIFIFKFCICFD